MSWMLALDGQHQQVQLPSIAHEMCDFSSYMFIVENFHSRQVTMSVRAARGSGHTFWLIT
jgi:hypothetical protein